ncbi:MAG: iron-containing alcohol dehydrogenase [Bacillota bacterium]|nr:iron-containing alcohol dehydrogenase [Clostridium sp.]MDT3844380.1 iron-containing alcohol dehydrogenase [Bacillota bacterium]
MQKFVYYAPTEIVFGQDTELQTAGLVKKYGGNRVVLIYGGKSAVKSGLIGRVEENLKGEGLEVLSCGGVVPNPLLSKAREIAKAAVEFKADFVLAVGGGSVIDTAKAVALVLAAPEHDVWDFWSKKAPLDKAAPLGSILTISAAGSETSNSTVLTKDDKTPPTKRGINSDSFRCRFTIMNPDLTMTLPVWQIGAGAADIFMHTSERYFAKILGNHLTDEIAEGLFRDIIKYGPIGVKDPKNYEAMSEIMWCGSVSHVGLTGIGAKGDTAREGDWACHQLGMAISALYDSTHGATLSAVWASWARYVKSQNLPRFAEFARKVYGIAETDDEKAADEGIQRTNEFFRSLGMPLTITELLGHEPTDEELTKLADECSYDHTRSIGSFKTLDYDDILAIYRMAK